MEVKQKSTGFLQALVAPKIVRWLGGSWLALSVYDLACSQLGFPTIREIWGVSGSLLPWWGWLLALQAILVVALFEYVRRQPQSIQAPPLTGVDDIRELVRDELDRNHVIRTGEPRTEPKPPPPPKPKLHLSKAEQERITDRLIQLDDYLSEDLQRIMEPILGLLDWREKLRHSSAGHMHKQIEAMRQPVAAQTREIAKTLFNFEAETAVLGLHPLAIKTKFVPLEGALGDFTNVSQFVAEDSIHHAPFTLPGKQLNSVIMGIHEEIERVRSDIADWRKRIALGELS